MKLVKAQRTSGLPWSDSSVSLSSLKSSSLQLYAAPDAATLATSSSSTRIDQPPPSSSTSSRGRTINKETSRYPPVSFSIASALSRASMHNGVKGKMKAEPSEPTALHPTPRLEEEQQHGATLLPCLPFNSALASGAQLEVHSSISPSPSPLLPSLPSPPINVGVEVATRIQSTFESTASSALLPHQECPLSIQHSRQSVPPLLLCPPGHLPNDATTPSPSSSYSSRDIGYLDVSTESKGLRIARRPAGPRPMSAVTSTIPLTQQPTCTHSHTRYSSDASQRPTMKEPQTLLTILTPPPISPTRIWDEASLSPKTSSLERNPSSSTHASSAFDQPIMTEESSIPETPFDPHPPSHQQVSLGQMDCALNLEHAFERPGNLPGSSTWSYQCDDDIQARLRPSGAKEDAASPHHWDFLSHPSTRLDDLATDSEAHSPTPHATDSSTATSKIPPASASEPRKVQRNLSTGGPVGPMVPMQTLQARVTPTEDTRSVTFREVAAPNDDYFRPRAIPHDVRGRAESLSGMSSHTTSMYSIGEVDYARGGITTMARIVTILETQAVQSPPAIEEDNEGPSQEVAETIERLKSSSDAMRRAFELDKPFLIAPRQSLSLRPPPLPPHLIARTAPVDGVPQGPLRQRHSSTPPGFGATSTSLQRTTPLGELWRRLSSGGKSRSNKEKTKSKTLPDSRLLPSKGDILTQTMTPEVPPVPPLLELTLSKPLGIKQLIKKASVKRLRSPKKAKPVALPNDGKVNTSPQLVQGPATDISPIKLDEKPALDEPSQKRRRMPPGLLLSNRTTSLVQLPLAASPLGEDSVAALPLDALVQDRLSAEELKSQHGRGISFGSPGDFLSPTAPISEAESEKRRRYRQTLVEIKDDSIFHQVLQDLARLETQSTPRPESRQRSHSPLWKSSSTDSSQHLEIKSSRSGLKSPSQAISERKTRESQIRVWFVTREIVQGERRHGRLLARGVKTVRAVANKLSMERGPEPSVRMTRSKSISGVARSSKPTRRRTLSISDTSGAEPPERKVPSSDSPAAESPLNILLERLPKLLAVSLTLSSSFDNDPSPYGVAVAFGAMEKDLCEEIGLWAGQVGNMVAKGLGEIIDRTPNGYGKNSAIELGEPGTDDDPDERLGFSDIIMAPITRALRYKLLFKELLDAMSTLSQSRHVVDAALRSAQRLGIECDRRQGLDLEQFAVVRAVRRALLWRLQSLRKTVLAASKRRRDKSQWWAFLPFATLSLGQWNLCDFSHCCTREESGFGRFAYWTG